MDAFLLLRLPASQVSSQAATVIPVSPGSRFRPRRFRTVSVSGSGAPHFADTIMSPILRRVMSSAARASRAEACSAAAFASALLPYPNRLTCFTPADVGTLAAHPALPWRLFQLPSLRHSCGHRCPSGLPSSPAQLHITRTL